MKRTEQVKLRALTQLLDLTGQEDWHLVHATVREDVARGELSKTFEEAYSSLVKEKATNDAGRIYAGALYRRKPEAVNLKR